MALATGGRSRDGQSPPSTLQVWADVSGSSEPLMPRDRPRDPTNHPFVGHPRLAVAAMVRGGAWPHDQPWGAIVRPALQRRPSRSPRSGLARAHPTRPAADDRVSCAARPGAGAGPRARAGPLRPSRSVPICATITAPTRLTGVAPKRRNMSLSPRNSVAPVTTKNGPIIDSAIPRGQRRAAGV